MENELPWVVVIPLVACAVCVYDWGKESASLWIKHSRFAVPSLLSFPNLTADSIVVAPAGTDR